MNANWDQIASRIEVLHLMLFYYDGGAVYTGRAQQLDYSNRYRLGIMVAGTTT